jgi:hypothetical protein
VEPTVRLAAVAHSFIGQAASRDLVLCNLPLTGLGYLNSVSGELYGHGGTSGALSTSAAQMLVNLPVIVVVCVKPDPVLLTSEIEVSIDNLFRAYFIAIFEAAACRWPAVSSSLSYALRRPRICPHWEPCQRAQFG